MAIQGVRGTGSIQADERPKNWREGILLLYPNGAAPLIALTSKLKTKSTDDPEFNWFEKQYATRRFVGTVSHGAGTTPFSRTFVMTGNVGQVKVGDILMFEEPTMLGMLALVTAVVAGTPDTVTASVGFNLTAGSTVPAWNPATAGVNPNILVVGSAYPEGDDTPQAIGYQPTKKRNFTQIFRRALSFTRTAMKTNLRTGDQVKEARREALEHHGVDMEYSLIFGQPSETVAASGQIRRTTCGIIEFIRAAAVIDPTQDSRTDFSGDVDMEELEVALEKVFRYGAQEKMAFAGNRALLTIQQVVRKNAAWQFESGIKEFGMNVTRLVTPFGTLVMKTHPLFNVLRGGTTGGTAYSGWDANMLILDMANLTYRPLKDSDTKYLPDRQGNGIDGMTSEFLTECGFEVDHPATHSVWTNMKRGVKDT